VVRLAVEAKVKSLLLFHHDPWRTDEAVDDMAARGRNLLVAIGSSLTLDAAREGSSITL